MATNSLGRLTLDLAVRLSDFSDGMSRAERETANTTRDMGKSVASFKDQLIDDLSGTPIGGAISSLNDKLSSISTSFGENGLSGAAKVGAVSVIGSLVAMGAGLVALSIKTANADEELVRLSERAKTSTKDMQVLSAVAGNYGKSMDGVSNALQAAQRRFGKFSASGGGGLVDTLKLLQKSTGMADDELEKFGKSLSTVGTVEAIQMVYNELEEAGATAEEVIFVTSSLSRGLVDLIPMWDNNGEAIKEYEKQLEQAGVIRTKESIEQSAILAAQMEATKIKFDGLRNQLVTEMIPALASLTTYFAEGTKKGDGFASSASGVGSVISGVAKTIIGFSSVVNLAVIGLQGLMDKFYVIGQTGSYFLSAQGFLGKWEALKWGDKALKSAGESTSRRVHDELMRAADAINNTGSVPVPASNDSNTFLQSATANLKANTVEVKSNAKAQEALAKSTGKAAKEVARLVGISGDTGVGRAHLHVQYRDKSRAVSEADLARFQAGGESIQSYGKTSGYGKRNTGIKGASTYHRGTDYGVPKNTPVTTTVPVKSVKTWHDAKGGGYVSTITFDDGVVIDLLHQMPSVMGVEKGASTGNKSVDKAANKADAMWQRAAADALSQRKRADADALREQEKLARNQLSIVNRYATAKEKIEIDHNKSITEIEGSYAKDSAERTKYLAREEAEYVEKRTAAARSILESYMAGEERLTYEHNEQLREINAKFIEGDPTRQMLVDLQKAAYQEDLANFKFAANEKAREQDRMYQSIANSARANSNQAASNGLDSMAQRTMSRNDYSDWRAAQDHDEAYDSVNDQYANRQSEINGTDERGEFKLPKMERNELLEIAKKEHLDKMWAMEQEYSLKDQTLAEQRAAQRVAIHQKLLGGMTEAASVFFGENSNMHKAAFALEKAYAIQKALMNVEETYTNTFNSISAIPLVGPYIAAPMAAAAAAMQVASAASIKGMSAPSVSGIAHGGLDNVPEESTYLLDKGERVLSPNQNKDLTNFLSKGNNQGGGITINNNSSAEVSARRNPDGTVTVEMVDKMIEKSFRRIGRANSIESKSIRNNTTARVQRS